MTISFNEIPTNLLTPIFATEFDNTKALGGASVVGWKSLLIGNRLSTGTIAETILKKLTSASQAANYFGKGSTIHDMARGWFENNTSSEIWAMALDDAGTAVQASGSFTMAGTATAAGSIAFYFGGERVSIGVAVGDTGADIAAALRTEMALTKHENVPVNIGGSSGTVDVELKNGGEFGNEYDLRVNHYQDELLPSGVTVTTVQPVSGATNPDLADAIAAMGEEQFNMIVTPYTDTANLTTMQTELEARWGPLTQNDGMHVVCKRATDAALGVLGDARNNPHEVIFGHNGQPTSPWKMAAQAGGQVSLAASIDPARPFQTLKLDGAVGAQVADRRTLTERNNVLTDGIATLREQVDGSLIIDRMVTTYKTNALGSADTSYRDANTMFTLSYLRQDWRSLLSLTYPRHKLADDGTKFGSGQKIVTPSVIKAEAINRFRKWELAGLVEGFDQFKDGLVVERNADDVNRIDVLLPPNIVNQLRIAATQIQFIL